MDYRNRAPQQTREILCPRHLHEPHPIPDSLTSRPIVIAIAVHNQGKVLGAALQSALQQTVVQSKQATILLLDDRSSDNWQKLNAQWLAHPSVALLQGHCGSPARARNALLDYIDRHFDAQWVCRLDADDTLATSQSVEAICKAGQLTGAKFVVGSNALTLEGQPVATPNIADPNLLSDRKQLTRFIEGFCLHDQKQELPSCNLALATHSGFRYPNMRSAEDHWLVAELLMLHADKGTILPQPLYAVYSLQGNDTRHNQNSKLWSDQRHRLAYAVRCWQQLLDDKVDLLGVGHEGCVWREGDTVHKRFYPWAMEQRHVDRLSRLLDRESPHFLRPTWNCDKGIWFCRTPYQPMTELGQFTDKQAITQFLLHLYEHRIAPLNIKRTNLLLNAEGELVLIDIGKDIVDLTVSRYLDICARTYSIGILGWSDEEVVRRLSTIKQDEALKALPGFEEFYQQLILSLHPELESPSEQFPAPTIAKNTTLLIKACAQDADVLSQQVQHIVSQLSYPKRFNEVLLLLDSYPGPFLRQYTNPDLPRLKEIAQQLHQQGWVDRILLAPEDPEEIRNTYQRWFDRTDVLKSHTTANAPLFSQLWAFEQVCTRYVLQCDCDVLVGRKQVSHDFLSEMLAALQPQDVLSVGFNIPKAKEGFREYEAQPGGYVPEVRMGLLDLEKIRQLHPLENPIKEGRFTLTWHRAIEHRQQKQGLRSLRGGDSRTFYVHPLNPDKRGLPLPLIRDLIAQGRYPAPQQEQFDLIPGPHWHYAPRSEPIVFLLKGSRTSSELVQRCLSSLKRQHDQQFGLIVIDDDSCLATSWQWPHQLRDLFPRTTLIRRQHHAGRGINFAEAIQKICTNSETLIAVLDQDDALMGPDVVLTLKEALSMGADLIQLPMFRPDKPLKQYHPDYNQPRHKGGGEVWAHLRTFKKALYDRIPKEYLYQEGEWIEPSDYSTMMAMVELAQKPVFVDTAYGYFHQRLPYSKEVKENQHRRLSYLMALEPLG